MRHFGVFTCKGDTGRPKVFFLHKMAMTPKNLVFNPHGGWGLRPPETGFGMLYVPSGGGGAGGAPFWRVFLFHQKYLWYRVFIFCILTGGGSVSHQLPLVQGGEC